MSLIESDLADWIEAENAHRLLVAEIIGELCEALDNAPGGGFHVEHAYSHAVAHLEHRAPERPRAERTKKAKIRATLRWEVFKRDGFRCLHCGTQDKLTADHIVAESKGGPTTLENLQTLCAPCNSRKGTK